MNYQNAAIIFLCLLSGCVTTTVVTKPDQYQQINDLGKERTALITVQKDTTTVDYHGEYLNLLGDSAYWQDADSHLMKSVPLVDVLRVRFRKSGAGALDGAGIGLVPGALLTVIGLAGSSSYAESGARAGVYISLGVMGGGGVIGSVIGALVQHKTDFMFWED